MEQKELSLIQQLKNTQVRAASALLAQTCMVCGPPGRGCANTCAHLLPITVRLRTMGLYCHSSGVVEDEAVYSLQRPKQVKEVGISEMVPPPASSCGRGSRQILYLFLARRVCSLHDANPGTMPFLPRLYQSDRRCRSGLTRSLRRPWATLGPWQQNPSPYARRACPTKTVCHENRCELNNDFVRPHRTVLYSVLKTALHIMHHLALFFWA